LHQNICLKFQKYLLNPKCLLRYKSDIFISQYTTRYGNYTEERRELFANQTLDDLVSQIKQRREHKADVESIVG